MNSAQKIRFNHIIPLRFHTHTHTQIHTKTTPHTRTYALARAQTTPPLTVACISIIYSIVSLRFGSAAEEAAEPAIRVRHYTHTICVRAACCFIVDAPAFLASIGCASGWQKCALFANYDGAQFPLLASVMQIIHIKCDGWDVRGWGEGGGGRWAVMRAESAAPINEEYA